MNTDIQAAKVISKAERARIMRHYNIPFSDSAKEASYGKSAVTRLLSALWTREKQLAQAEARADELERQRDYVLDELLEALAQWDGEWMPHFEDYDPCRKSVCTKEEAIASWLSHTPPKAAQEGE